MARIRLHDYPSLFYQSGMEHSQYFIFNFAGPYRHFVLRLTGGCELADEHIPGLRNVEDALTGIDGFAATTPLFTGIGLFGGTRYKEMTEPDGFIPGITEVFPTIALQLPQAAFLGVVAKNSIQRYTPWGVVVSEDEKKGRFTVIHPTAKSILVLQPSVDRIAPWDLEYQECYRICDQLDGNGWQSLLLVYNGGGVTEKEICLWAENDRNVLLINGSGRIADKYAGDQQFLRQYPHVHVAENNVASIRSKLLELGALTYPR